MTQGLHSTAKNDFLIAHDLDTTCPNNKRWTRGGVNLRNWCRISITLLISGLVSKAGLSPKEVVLSPVSLSDAATISIFIFESEATTDDKKRPQLRRRQKVRLCAYKFHIVADG